MTAQTPHAGTHTRYRADPADPAPPTGVCGVRARSHAAGGGDGECAEMVTAKTSVASREPVAKTRDHRPIAPAPRCFASECARLKIEAERKAGEMLAAGIRHQGGRPTNADSVSALQGLGIEQHQSKRWQKVARVPAKVVDEHAARCDRALWPLLASTGASNATDPLAVLAITAGQGRCRTADAADSISARRSS